jgi:hypothetical protein
MWIAQQNESHLQEFFHDEIHVACTASLADLHKDVRQRHAMPTV